MLNHVQLFATPWTVAHHAPLSTEFSRQEYWSRLSFLSPGDLPDPEIEAVSLASPATAGRFFTAAPPGKPENNYVLCCVKSLQSCPILYDPMDYSLPGF